MHLSRRDVLLGGLLGTGWVGLRALATGLPPLFFLHPRKAMAEAADPSTAQYLILSTSGAGDPLNCNAPGTYDLPAAYPANQFVHPTEASMAPAKIALGGQQVTAAAPWASMDAMDLAHTAFIHHATMTANHGDQPNVMRLMGAVRRGQMATSLIAARLAKALGTVQSQPLVLGEEVTQVDGQYQPRYTPLGIKQLLAGTSSPISASNLVALRDAELKRLSDLFKGSRTTQAERAFVDNLAQSQSQLREVSQSFGQDLSKIRGNGADDQCTIAVLMAKMKVAPMYTVHIPFGGDNHSDVNLAGESAATVSGVATINSLMGSLRQHELADKVTFVSLNVFGRTFYQDTPGRGHNGGHHVTVAIGSKVKPGVYGALGPDGRAMNIDPANGAAVNTGGIELGDGLASVGKTVGMALGVDRALLDDQITAGQPITGVLSS